MGAAEPHLRFHRAVRGAIVAEANFDSHREREVGWAEVREAWMRPQRNGRPTPWEGLVGRAGARGESFKFGDMDSDYTLTTVTAPVDYERVDAHCDCETPLIQADDDVKAEEYFDRRPSCDDYKWLINAAWTVLLENLDLIEDAAAVYERSAMGDLSNQVLGREFFVFYWEDRTTIECYAITGAAKYSSDDNTLTLQLDPYLKKLKSLLGVANAAAGSDKRKGRACVAADLAATILHELVHAADFAHGDSKDEGFSSYEIENYFRYYVMKRLCVLGWGCCNWGSGSVSNYDALVGDADRNSDSYYIGAGNNNCLAGGAAC